MSASIIFTPTEEWMGTVWASRSGTSFDFGADPSRVFDVEEICGSFWTETVFFGDDGAWADMTGQEFWERIEGLNWTFGEFGGTMEVGSGSISTFEGI